MRGLIHLIETVAIALASIWAKGRRVATTELSAATEFLIGTANAFGTSAPQPGSLVTIALSVLSKHCCIFGASGCGKTTLSHRLRDALIEAVVNFIDIDYRGDSLDRTLKRIVSQDIHANRLTLIDLRNMDWIVPLNFLGYGPGDPFNRAGILFTSLKEMYQLGVQVAQDLRGALLAAAFVRWSVVEVPLILSPDGEAVRRWMLSQISDEYVNGFLTSYSNLPQEVQRNRASAVTNKLDEFLCHPILRASLGAEGAPDMAEIMRSPGHITLVALGADRAPHAALVGRMMVSAVQRAAMAQVDVSQNDRVDVRLICDEAQNLLGEEATETLAEGRRFKLGLVACAQFAGQLSSELQTSMKVNCATQLYFQTSSAEASSIAAEVVSSLSKDEVRQTLLGAPVGAAVVMRRGCPATYVTTPDSPDPEVDQTGLEEYRVRATCRTAIRLEEAQASMARRIACFAVSEEEVRHVRKPTRRDR